MNTTVLVLGDESDWESYNRFCEQLQKHHSKKLKWVKWVTATYDLLEKNRLPLIESDMLIIYLFFPFTYWDKHVEKEGYKGVYGNVYFYNKFRAFWSEIHRTSSGLFGLKFIGFSERSIVGRKYVL